jgi:multidrug efflux system membrane fusion protein
MSFDSVFTGDSRPGCRAGLWPVLSLCLFLLLSGCSGAKEAKGGKGEKGGKAKSAPVPVSVATSMRKDMPVTVEAIGTVEPFASVGIKSQVAGVLEKVNFHEGDPVKAGDLLFAIDPRPFAARLDQARATLAKDQAALDNARKQAERYGPAAEKGYVSEEQSDQAQTSVATLAALVQADQAALASARLDLDNCTIRAPISGATGELLVTEGNLVKASDDQPLVTINQIVPVKVSFTLPEQTLPELKKHLTGGELAIWAIPPGDGAQPQSGRFAFLDNMIDQSTGTIRLKATFANPDRGFWPGQFVKVSLRLTTRRAATVVPAPAVQTSQTGAYVYVVKPDQSVEERPVIAAFSFGGESVIDSGLAVGETVVTDGQLRLKPGALVKALPAGAKAEKGGASK